MGDRDDSWLGPSSRGEHCTAFAAWGRAERHPAGTTAQDHPLETHRRGVPRPCATFFRHAWEVLSPAATQQAAAAVRGKEGGHPGIHMHMRLGDGKDDRWTRQPLVGMGPHPGSPGRERPCVAKMLGGAGELGWGSWPNSICVWPHVHGCERLEGSYIFLK